MVLGFVMCKKNKWVVLPDFAAKCRVFLGVQWSKCHRASQKTASGLSVNFPHIKNQI